MIRWKTIIAIVLLMLPVCLGYFCALDVNPPGFFIDESSIAYNAWTIATRGRDEHGVAMPLFFKAFGEYKNPVYIYGLAVLWRFVRPSNLAARSFSAAAGVLTAVVLGVLGFLITRRTWIAATVFLLAAATPMLFEISRLVYEVALFPLATALFLLAAWRASQQEHWNVATITALIAALTLLTYTYSIGRLLAPLFAVGLITLLNRDRARSYLAVLLGYSVVGVLPWVAFQVRHPEFGDRFAEVSYLSETGSVGKAAGEFARHFFKNLDPVLLTRYGDPEPKHHVPASGGSILAGVLILAAAGAVAVLWKHRADRWWHFVLFGTFASVVPASLTGAQMHALRLSPLPVFLLVLSIPILQLADGSRRWRMFAVSALLLAAIQAGYFQHVFHRDGRRRWKEFHVAYRVLFQRLVESGRRPIIIPRHEYVYVYGLWYGVAAGLRESEFRLADGPPPPGAVVIAPLLLSPRERVVDSEWIYCVYEADETALR